MRRRKLLIGIGAAAAGGSAAFGTEAFTSVQAERNVDVAVAGDRSSFVAIQPLSSSNASTYVDTESDNTVEIELDGDRGSGEGVTQDAITQLEDLFRVVNQGSQEVSVYFEDDSDAVTFRVTRSASTSTTGSNGQSLEGPDNSVELAVGEQVVAGMTVDTLNNDVSGQLLDEATLYADANASAPQQSIPEPQYIVTDSPSANNEFGDIQSAINAAEVGSVVGIDGSTSLSPSSQISVDVEDVTLTGFNGKPTVDSTSVDPPGGSDGGGAVQIRKDGVTLQNFNIDYSAESPDDTNGIEANGLSDITVDGMRVENTADPDGSPAINTEGTESVTVTNNEVLGAAIGVYFDGSDQNTSTINNNYVDLNPGDGEAAQSGGPTEGIFVYGDATDELSNNDLEIRNNEVVDKPSGEEGIKALNSPSRINNESGTEAQLESLLEENNISKASVNGELGTKSSGFSDIQSAVNAASRLTLVESGTYDESVSISSDNFRLKGPNAGKPVEQWGSESGQAVVNGQIELSAAGVSVNGMTVSPDSDVFSSKPAAAVYCTAPDSKIEYNRIADFTIDIKNINPNSIHGIQIYEESGNSDRIENIRVENNVVDNINYQGDSNGSGGFGTDYGNLYGIHVQGGVGDTGDSNGVKLRGNTVSNLSSAGYILGTAVSETGSGPATPKNVTIVNNELVYFDSEQPIPGVAFNIGTDAGEVALGENSIKTPRGVEHKGSGTLDATDNYWDDSSGPSGGYTDPDGVTANGGGARIDITQNGEVDFSPFKKSDT